MGTEALEVLKQLQPARSYLTHICHDLPHVATNQALPAGVELAYDGLTFDIEMHRSSFAEAAEDKWT